MSQKASTRKGATNEEKEKRQSDSPVKEMKKKMAVTAEKEKQAAEKTEKSEKQPEKSTEKTADKKEKSADKKEAQPEKPKEDTSKGEKSGKTDKHEGKQRSNKVHNGVTDVTLSTNGGADDLNGTVSEDADELDDAMLAMDDDQHDDLFPELVYDTSDTECFESPTPDAPSRSLTRRSQVKSTRTPETPRPASDKQTDKDNEENKDSKVLKLKEDATSSDRKLRSSDSPKRDAKKTQEAKRQDTAKDQEKNDADKKTEEQPKEQEKTEPPKEQQKESNTPIAEVRPEVKENEKNEEENKQSTMEQFEMEVVVEVEADAEPRKLDTNYSKSRVKVSPYRRSLRLADQTTSSVAANYTGNNTTMEMDITETSVASADESALERSFLRAIRNIRGRNSYKQLDQLDIKHLVNRTPRPTTAAAAPGREVSREVRETRETRETVESVWRPTAPVVGRKRGAAGQAAGEGAGQGEGAQPAAADPELAAAPAPKRGRLLHRIAHTFRRADTAPEIVGINTDLPLTAPVASAESFDPERLKTSPLGPEPAALPLATPLAPHETRDNKRCAIM